MITQMLALVGALGLTYLLLRLRHFILAYEQDQRKYYRAYLVRFDETDWDSGPDQTDPDQAADDPAKGLTATPRTRAKNQDQNDLSEWPTELDLPAAPAVRLEAAPAEESAETLTTRASGRSSNC